MFSSIQISGSGLTAERLRLDTIAANLANANSSAPPGEAVFQRLMVSIAPAGPGGRPQGVVVRGIQQADTQPRLVFDPDHPDADANGYVAYANIDVVTEMVDMITASRAYEANITAINIAKAMFHKALDIGR
ncbi:MAG: flagellar basal body rod protein FlgC [Limnochordia bacterium]|jgi:flagellar basal-body rod protein FlgC